MPSSPNVRPLFSAIVLAAAVVLCATVPNRIWASPRIYPTGVTVYDPSRTYNSFICFSSPDGNTHLVDMDG
ncbi:MAG: hypothetical protein ABSC06_07390, partial [Rhodopila sp.]